MAIVAKVLGYTYEAGRSFGVEALRGVDLEVARGDLLVVAGTTGSGKSTLLRMLAGLLRPTVGAVTVDGEPAFSRSVRGMTAIVFQNPETQFFSETLLADVAFGPRNLGHEQPEVAAARALEAVGLDVREHGGRSPFGLSGGEARRGAIAGALAMGARYLLLDEPTAGLDARGRRDVVGAIRAQRDTTGIVVVTHDPEDLLDLATGVLALDSGRTAFAGSVTALYDDPAAYLAAGLRLPAVVETQLLARARGARIDPVTTDPVQAAEALLTAREAGA